MNPAKVGQGTEVGEDDVVRQTGGIWKESKQRGDGGNDVSSGRKKR